MVSKPKFLGPNQKITSAQAAVMLAVSARTLERTIAALERGETPQSHKHGVLIASQLFVEASRVPKDVHAGELYKSLGLQLKPEELIAIEPITWPEALARKVRARKAVITSDKLPSLDEANPPSNEAKQSVKDLLWGIVYEAQNGSTGKIPWKQIKLLADWLTKAGIPPQGKLEGVSIANIDLAKVRSFGSLGNFLARAELSDVWPFILPTIDSRPVDLLSANKEEITYGLIVYLTIKQWMTYTQSAIAIEKAIADADAEAQALGSLISKKRKSDDPSIPKRRRKGI